MTQTTDQERAEFEAAYVAEKLRIIGSDGSADGEKAIRRIHLRRNANGDYDNSLEAHFAWWAWQAARRAQVVPQGWKDQLEQVLSDLQTAPYPAIALAVKRVERLLAAAPQSPEAACNPSMQPELATEATAEHEALRSVYEAARGLLRYEGVDDGRAIIYRAKLNNAIEDVKQIDGGLWESPEAAPVQLPESISKVLEDCRARAIDYATCPSPYNNTRMETAFQYLEHQVRQLLAAHAHGITQAKQGGAK